MGIMKSKFYFFVLSTFCMTLCLVGLLYTYDPMMFFHKNYFRDLKIPSDMRIFAPGAIRFFEHDSYILGTSVMVNSSADRFSESLGGHFANLSMDGADYFERSYPLRLMLEKKAKTVVFSLDAQYLDQQEGKVEYPKSLLDEMYSNNLSRIRYYFNTSSLGCALAYSSSKFCIGSASDFNHPSEWFTDRTENARFGGVENWLGTNNHQIRGALKRICGVSENIKAKKKLQSSINDIENRKEKAKDYVYKYLLSYVERNPDTDFILVFPPYSRVRFAEWYQYDIDSSIIHVEIVKYVTDLSGKVDNLQVFSFEDMEFLDELINYKDPNHYSKDISELITEYIKNKKGLLSPSTIDTFISAAEKRSLDFDYVKFSGYFCSSTEI